MRISIVTPSFNQREYLAQTLQSVLGQQGSFDLEHLVVDGQSTDGSVELLRSNNDPRLKWSSGKDSGQSDAINRGLRQVSGDVVGWLNSDDLYTPHSLAVVSQAFDDSSVNWVVGRCQIIDSVGNIIRPGITRYKDRLLDRYSYESLLRENCISQPAVFWRRTFGERVGLLDESLHHAMDYDLWLRMAKLDKPKILPQVTSQFRIHPASKSGRLNRERFNEDLAVAARHFNGNHLSLWIHRLNNEKIVWAYRLMQLIGK
jgi:glycosyltransferase involved in cell wall biosynthesis